MDSRSGKYVIQVCEYGGGVGGGRGHGTDGQRNGVDIHMDVTAKMDQHGGGTLRDVGV